MIWPEPQTIATLARLTGALGLFDRAATTLVGQVREAMSVPGEADADVETEFHNFRAHLETFLPEFQQKYARLLIRHLGAEHLPEVMAALETATVQRYVEAAERMDAAMVPLLAALVERMLRLARDTNTD
jgi:hypothetical protein